MKGIGENTYGLAGKDMLVYFNCLVVDHVQIRIQTLGQSLRELLFIRNRLVWVAINGAFELLKAVAEIGPFSSPLKCCQNLCELLREALCVYKKYEWLGMI